MNNDETTQYLKNYQSGLDELEAREQLDEEMQIMGLFNTQNKDEIDGENSFISNLVTQDNEESKLKDVLLPEDTYKEDDEPLPQAKKRSLSNMKNRRKFKFSKVTPSKARVDEEVDGTNLNQLYRNSMINDFKLNHIIDEDSD